MERHGTGSTVHKCALGNLFVKNCSNFHSENLVKLKMPLVDLMIILCNIKVQLDRFDLRYNGRIGSNIFTEIGYYLTC